jgi:hypothetical protein
MFRSETIDPAPDARHSQILDPVEMVAMFCTYHWFIHPKE